MSCPFMNSSEEAIRSSESDKKDGGGAKLGACYYHEYLQLDKILDANNPRSAQFEENGAAHDEHLFITIHQAYELWFKQILYELDSCIVILDHDIVDDRLLLTVAHRFGRVNRILKLLVDQFHIMDTMTPLDFLEFRRYLFPASGFQSVQFRLLENRLGLPKTQRIRYNKVDYNTVLEKEHSDKVRESETQKTMFQVIEKWLERCPYTHIQGFEFWNEYGKSVTHMIETERASQSAEDGAAYYKSMRETFAIVYEPTIYEKLRKEGKVRLSFNAFKSALMIMLYRDLPIFQMPFHLLQAVLDMDSLLTSWRYSHASMVHRQLGSKIGTGGSTGFHYLRTAASYHRVFGDFFNLSTYMIPKSFLAELPEHVEDLMGFQASPLISPKKAATNTPMSPIESLASTGTQEATPEKK